MKLLSFESSAIAASVCVTDEEKLIAQYYQNCGLTHSCTLLPMAENLLESTGLTLADIDAFAVASGPGSFTGVRIGVSTVKGLAQGTDKLCMGVSSLKSMAWNLCIPEQKSFICAVMDARAGQLYNGIFQLRRGAPHRLTPDRLITIDELREELISLGQSYILVGDGAQLCYNELKGSVAGLSIAPANLCYPHAYGVAMLARQYFIKGQGVRAEELEETYLRAPQAERERLANTQEERKI